MRTLRIEKGGKIFVGGELADVSQLEDKSEFFSSLLTLDVELSDDVNVGDIIHFFYDSKELVRSLLSEEYEVVRALATTIELPRDYKSFRVFKSFKIEYENEEEFMYMIPEVELIPALPGEDGIRNLSGLPVVIDENIRLVHEETNTIVDSNTKITLLDLMVCLFEDLASLLKEGALLSQ